MRDASADADDRIEAALNLIGWVNSDGFLPDTADDFGGDTATRLLEECRLFARTLAPEICGRSCCIHFPGTFADVAISTARMLDRFLGVACVHDAGATEGYVCFGLACDCGDDLETEFIAFAAVIGGEYEGS